jgi:hypothetical protein
MTYNDIIRNMEQAGYSYVNTMAGPLPLHDWHPYGLVRGGVNYREGCREWQGEIIGEGRVRDLPAEPVEPPFLLGVWEFSK